jgi:nicotinamide mononucleotide transporter
MNLLAEAWQTLLASSLWELSAMILALAYLLLAVRQIIWCWLAAFVSTLIYSGVFLQAQLFMDAALQVFYALMAIYGWSQWRHGGHADSALRISKRPMQWHGITLAVIVLTSLVSGFLLSRYTNAAFPYLDSFTTWASVIATWMVARKVLENWIYWIAIDSVSVYLYVHRGLYLTVILFILYVMIAVAGWQIWKSEYRKY